MTDHKDYGVIVVGAGHAGCEAALAPARMGVKTLLLTINADHIAAMSCNPAVGGLAKGQLVKEIDALGGEMGKNIDYAGIQFRILNTRKGPAVRSSRAQADRNLYKQRMKLVLEEQEGLDVKQGMVETLVVENGRVVGVKTEIRPDFYRPRRHPDHPGLFWAESFTWVSIPSRPAAWAIRLRSTCPTACPTWAFPWPASKPGPTPRLDGRTIDYSGLSLQPGDDPPRPFSFWSEGVVQRQVPCYLTYTNEKTHEAIRSGLDRSPLLRRGHQGNRGPAIAPRWRTRSSSFRKSPGTRSFWSPRDWTPTRSIPTAWAPACP